MYVASPPAVPKEFVLASSRFIAIDTDDSVQCVFALGQWNAVTETAIDPITPTTIKGIQTRKSKGDGNKPSGTNQSPREECPFYTYIAVKATLPSSHTGMDPGQRMARDIQKSAKTPARISRSA
jgi:hypothetical protein